MKNKDMFGRNMICNINDNNIKNVTGTRNI